LSSEYEKGKYGSVGVAAVRNGSTRVDRASLHKLFLYVCRCGSTRVGAGKTGIRCRSTRVESDQNSLLRGLHSVNAVIHSRISNRIHTELKLYRPGSTRTDPHRNPCQFLMDSESTIRRRKKFWSCSNFYTDFDSVLARFEPHQPAIVVYSIVLHAMGCDKVLHTGRYWSIGV
jgi:hypothetical protein